MDSPAPCVDKLLQEHFAEDSVRLFPEDGAEDDRYPVVACLDVDCLLFSVVDGPDFTTFPHTLWCALGRVLACLLVKVGVFIKGLLEGCSHSIALEQAYPSDQVISCLLFGWQVVQIYLNREIVALLWFYNVLAVLAGEHRFGTIADQVGEALHGDGYEDLSLGVGCGNVEGDAVKIGDDLVD